MEWEQKRWTFLWSKKLRAVISHHFYIGRSMLSCLNVKTSPKQISSVQLLSRVRLFATPWIAARQASLSITNSWSLPKLMSIESEIPSNHFILCHPLLLLPSVFPSIRVFSNESALLIRWPKYWSFSFNISPTNEHPGLISFRMDWLDLLAVQGLSRVFSNTTVQKHQFFCAQLSSQSNSRIHISEAEAPILWPSDVKSQLIGKDPDAGKDWRQ